MGKSANDAIMDAGLNETRLNANQIHVCTSEPTTRAEATTTYNLASGSVSSTDFTLANGDTSGRKSTCAAQTGLSIASSGSAQHVAITDATRLLLVTTCPAQSLTAGGTVDVAAFDQEIGDPT